MKYLLFLIAFSVSNHGIACECTTPPVTERFVYSDFVGRVILQKNYPNEENDLYYKADIQFIDIYKGEEIKSIFIYGLNIDNAVNSCGILYREGTELLIYGNQDFDGRYTMGPCSGHFPIFKISAETIITRDIEFHLEKQQLTVDILNALKSKNVNFTTKLKIGSRSIGGISLEQFEGIKLDKNFGIYEVTLSFHLNAIKVRTISGFREDVDVDINELLRSAKWSSIGYRDRNNINVEIKYLIGFYYHKAKGNYPSRISIHKHI